MEEILRGIVQVSTYIFEISTLFLAKQFFSKMSQQICSDRHGMRTKKILFSVSRLSNCIRIFWHFFSLLFLEEEGKQYQFRGGAICYKPPFPRQMMTNKEVFSPRFL